MVYWTLVELQEEVIEGEPELGLLASVEEEE